MLSCIPRLTVLQVYWVGPFLGATMATAIYFACDVIDIKDFDTDKNKGKYSP